MGLSPQPSRPGGPRRRRCPGPGTTPPTPPGRFTSGPQENPTAGAARAGGRPYSAALDQQCDRPVVGQLDRHQRAEHTAPRTQALAEALVERLGLLGWRGRDVARPVALACV